MNRLFVDEHLIRPLIKRLIDSAKRSVLNRHRSRPHRLLETELYANWLDELGFVLIALDVSFTYPRKGDLLIPPCRMLSAPKSLDHGNAFRLLAARLTRFSTTLSTSS